MKNRILPILMIVINYLAIYPILLGYGLPSDQKVSFILPVIFFYLLLVINILNSIYPFVMLKYGENSRTLLFWNMLLKLLNIPIFIIIWFSTSMLALMAPFVILLAIVFDYILLLSSSMYGVSGLIKAYREGKITVIALIINIILHLIFCLDVISAVVMYITVKRKDKTQPIHITDNEHTEKYEHFFDILEKSDKLLIQQAKEQNIDICHIEHVTSFVDPRVGPFICIFFNTDSELENYKQNGTTRLVEDLYNKILLSLDSQNYNFSFEFDSEENVNKNYAGSYFYRMR